METTLIKVGGMSCQGCVKSVTGVLRELHDVAAVEVSLEKGEAQIQHGPGVSIEQLRQVVIDAGFDAD